MIILKSRCNIKLILGYAVFQLLPESTFSLILFLLPNNSITLFFDQTEAKGKYKQVIKFG